MSKIALEGNASGTGTLTIASQNTNSNYTLTLPNSTGTLVVTGGAQTIEFAAGTAAAPSITFTGDTNTGIFSPAADTIAFAEGGAEAMRIDSSGNVGIGTSSPSSFGKLAIRGGITVNAGTTSITGTGFSTSDAINSTFFINHTSGCVNLISDSALTFWGASGSGVAERMRIDSSGNVGIGTTSATTYGGTALVKTINIGSLNNISAGFSDAVTGTLRIAHASNQNIINFDASNLCFQSGGTTPTERARITSDGDFCIGNTAAINSARLTAKKGSARDVIAVFTNTGENYGRIQFADANYFVGGGGYGADWTAGSGVSMSFVVNQSATPATASLSTTGVWTNASDIRYKENVVPIPYGLAEIMQLKPSSYNMIGSDKKQIGLIAQDILPIIPEVVESVYCEPLDEDRYTLSYGNLVAVCIKAIQELKAITDTQATRIEALEAEVAALKGQ